MLVSYLLIVAFVSYIIAVACESFDAGSRTLGRLYKFPPGIRGATINAIGSSLPELFTTSVFLFFYVKQSGLSAGIATCVGSALFNSVVIPGLCIIAVLWKGVTINGVHQTVTKVIIDRGSFLRDAIFFVMAELALITMLFRTHLAWWMGALLVVLYIVYVYYLYLEVMRNRKARGEVEDEEEEDEEEEEEETPSRLKQVLTLDFHGLFYNYGELNAKRAWTLLGASVFFIGGACHVLADMVQKISVSMGIPSFFVAVILAAAATSVPDTIISVKDALKGDYEDAVANAFGSNIFDITICIGLPVMIYGLFIGPVPYVVTGTAPGAQLANVQELQILLIIVTLLTVILALGSNWKRTELSFGKAKAVLMFSFYIGYLVYVYGRIAGWPMFQQFSKYLTLG
jgi:cation:H+ antiporter